jgi:hypothetical protein
MIVRFVGYTNDLCIESKKSICYYHKLNVEIIMIKSFIFSIIIAVMERMALLKYLKI